MTLLQSLRGLVVLLLLMGGICLGAIAESGTTDAVTGSGFDLSPSEQPIDRDVLPARLQQSRQARDEARQKAADAEQAAAAEASGVGGAGVPGVGRETEQKRAIARQASAVADGTAKQVQELIKQTVRAQVRASNLTSVNTPLSVSTGSANPESGSILFGSVGALLLAGLGARAGQFFAYGGGVLVRVAVEPNEAEAVASMLHDMREARDLMSRRERWRNEASVPCLWAYAAFRTWTRPWRS